MSVQNDMHGRLTIILYQQICKCTDKTQKKHYEQWRIQDFHLGGAQKITCANAIYYEREIRSPFRQGSRARLRALEALGVFNAL